MAESIPQILRRFKEENTIVREKVETISGSTIHSYIARSDISTAISQNTIGTHISGKVYNDLRSKLRIVKLIKKADRATPRTIPTEQLVLSTLSKHSIHSHIQAFPERDNPHNTWITMPHIGPSLKELQTAQRDYRSRTGTWLELPQYFLWRTLHGVARALAWLHCGVSSDYKGASIIFDMPRLDEHGYPAPVLYHFQDSVYGPISTELQDWRPANEELENVAGIFHYMTHGRAYRNEQVDGRWCDCLTSTAPDIAPDGFLKCKRFPPSRKFRDLLEVFAYATEEGDATAADLLAMLNSPLYQREFGYGCANVGWYPLPEAVEEVFGEHVVGNRELRSLIPELMGVWGDVDDGCECMHDIVECAVEDKMDVDR